MIIHDISLPVSNHIPFYPGDVVVSSEPICTIEKSGCNMLKITLGTHTGTHIDAPYHFLERGKWIDEMPLHIFFGPVRVVEIAGDVIDRDSLETVDLRVVKRILFKTKNSNLLKIPTFTEKYVHLTLDAAQYISTFPVLLVGIDYVSVERFGTSDFIVHKTLLERGIAILEGIHLSAIPPGDYTLVAFPLKIEKGDGSPVRACLISEEKEY